MSTLITTKTTITVNNGFDTTEFTVFQKEPEIKMWIEVARLLGGFNKVKAIKLIRSEFDCGLREAKHFVEDAMR